MLARINSPACSIGLITPNICLLSIVNNNVVNIATGYGTNGTPLMLNIGSLTATVGKIYSYASSTSAQALANNSAYTLTQVSQLPTQATLVAGDYIGNASAITAGSTTLAGAAQDVATNGLTAAIPYTSDVKFVFCDASTGTVTVLTGVQAVASAGTAAALITKDSDGNFVIPVVYIAAAPTVTTSANVLFLAKTNGTEYTNSVSYNDYVAYLAGAATPIMTTADNSALVGTFCTYAKDATTGAYTLAAYTTATGAINSVYTAQTVTAAAASYLFSSTNLTNVNAANATVIDLTGTGLYASLSDINTAVAASKTVTAAVVYDNLSTDTAYNTVSYIFVVSVA